MCVVAGDLQQPLFREANTQHTELLVQVLSEAIPPEHALSLLNTLVGDECPDRAWQGDCELASRLLTEMLGKVSLPSTHLYTCMCAGSSCGGRRYLFIHLLKFLW